MHICGTFSHSPLSGEVNCFHIMKDCVMKFLQICKFVPQCKNFTLNIYLYRTSRVNMQVVTAVFTLYRLSNNVSVISAFIRLQQRYTHILMLIYTYNDLRTASSLDSTRQDVSRYVMSMSPSLDGVLSNDGSTQGGRQRRICEESTKSQEE